MCACVCLHTLHVSVASSAAVDARRKQLLDFSAEGSRDIALKRSGETSVGMHAVGKRKQGERRLVW